MEMGYFIFPMNLPGSLNIFGSKFTVFCQSLKFCTSIFLSQRWFPISNAEYPIDEESGSYGLRTHVPGCDLGDAGVGKKALNIF